MAPLSLSLSRSSLPLALNLPSLYNHHHHPPPLLAPAHLVRPVSNREQEELRPRSRRSDRSIDHDVVGGGAGRRRRPGGAAGGVDPVGAAGARGGAQRRPRGGGRGGAEDEEAGGRRVGVPGADEAGDLCRRVPGAHLPVRRLQPLMLRRRLHLPRPLPPPPPRARRRLLQCPPPPHHLRPHRRQVRRRHMLQQRLLREGGRDQPDGDELPGGGLPLRHRLRPQRHAGCLRLLLRRPADRDGLPRTAAVAAAHRRLPQLAAALLARPRGRRRRRRRRRRRMPPPQAAAAHRLITPMPDQDSELVRLSSSVFLLKLWVSIDHVGFFSLPLLAVLGTYIGVG